jgi:RimJ/RimL family protein N-acetyltransferase
MQKSWRNDSDKLTFIICEEDPSIAVADLNPIKAGEFDTPATMVGDINLFLSPYDDGEKASETEVVGEVELMIAVQRLRRNGLGKSALLLFIGYILENREKIAGAKKLVELRAKIHGNNEGSLALFENIGFKRIGEKVNFFGEWDLSIPLDEDNVAALKGQIGQWKPIGYVGH